MKNYIKNICILSSLLIPINSYHFSYTTPQGLSNKGNTCFLNALLQNLLNLHELNDEIMQMPIKTITNGNDIVKQYKLTQALHNVPTINGALFTNQTQSMNEQERLRLINQIKLQKQLQAYRDLFEALHNPTAEKQEIKKQKIDQKLTHFVTTICRNQWNLNKTGNQEDPTEALQNFFPAMSRTAEPWKWFSYIIDQQTIIFDNNSNLHGGGLPSNTTYGENEELKMITNVSLNSEGWICQEPIQPPFRCVKRTSFDHNEAKQVLVNIPINRSIQESINYFQQEETIAEKNINLGSFNLAVNNRTKKLNLYAGDNHYIIISLKRFNDKGQKINTPITIQKNITIKNRDNRDNAYELIGMIIHLGATSKSGHYIAYIADQYDREQRWYLCDDSTIVPQDSIFDQYNNVKATLNHQPNNNGYVLFYKRSAIALPVIASTQDAQMPATAAAIAGITPKDTRSIEAPRVSTAQEYEEEDEPVILADPRFETEIKTEQEPANEDEHVILPSPLQQEAPHNITPQKTGLVQEVLRWWYGKRQEHEKPTANQSSQQPQTGLIRGTAAKTKELWGSAKDWWYGKKD